MRVAITSYKGGVGKTTTALNLAGAMAEITGARVLLVDGDPNRSAIRWRDRGDGLPFTVCAEKQAPRYWPEADHVVIDTAARPSVDDLRDLLEIVDFVLIATTPDTLALDTLRPAIDTLSTAGGATRRAHRSSREPGKSGAGSRTRTAARPTELNRLSVSHHLLAPRHLSPNPDSTPRDRSRLRRPGR